MPRDSVPTSESVDEPDRIIKAGDSEGIYGTTARYWINQHLPDLARTHFAGGGRQVLDLGCGDGPNASILARAGIAGEYIGVDLAASPLWHDRAGRQGDLVVRFQTHDAHRIGEIDQDFDALVSVSAFEHFRDDHAVMQGLARRMRPGARGIVIVPSPYGNLVWGFRHGYRTYTPERFGRLLEGTPFRVIDSVASGALPSLCANAIWRGASIALTYAVLGAVWTRHAGNREAAKRQTPWLPFLAGTIQYGHLRTAAGRALHRNANRRLLDLDKRVPGFAAQWVFVIERS